MTTIATRTGRYPGAPRLRLLAGREASSVAKQRLQAPRAPQTLEREVASAPVARRATQSSSAGDAPVLVAGKDATRRDSMIDELASTMAPGTRFAHAAASWEVLALAGSSRMVILSGELEEISNESLMRMLSHRYPALPVVALDAQRALTHA
ncbi:MAG TPA: hypothetical protein VN804_05545 [Solirubrobacteraceae bacterium]|nr:hypothetical protein [Solirubrobacteraceae bacterium]